MFSAINSATALRHALEHAGAAGERVAETLAKLDVEFNDARIESERVDADRSATLDALKRAQHALDATRIARVARESELASARIEHEWRAGQVRAREHDLAGLDARLTSLEQLDAARAGFGDAARAVLANANGDVNQKGAVADYIEVNTGYERAVDACLSDLLQHVVVERPEHAAAGFAVVRDVDAGRCGFLIADGVSPGVDSSLMESALPDGVVAVSSVVHVGGDYANAIRHAIGEAWLADSYERAEAASHIAACPVVTREGEVFRGPNLVTGGIRRESHGILETSREIKDLRERIASEREALAQLADETAALDATIAQALAGVDALTSEHHKQEKSIVAHEARLQQTADEAARQAQKVEQLTRERRQAEEERETIDRRQAEARVSIARLETEQQTADDRLAAAQRRLFEARESAEALSQQAADARASHAGLVERATALAGEVERLEEAGAELEVRAASLAAERDQTRRRIEDLRAAVAAGRQTLDDDMRALEEFRRDVAHADESASLLRTNAEEHEIAIKQARASLEALRAAVSELDIARATAESDLSHLASSCVEAVQATLDEVVAEVEELERQGEATPDARVIDVDQGEESESDEESTGTPVEAVGVSAVEEATERALSAEEAIAELRRKIERLGPVNMMAIEQFDELESRHSFLTTQRKDLVDSIAQTSEAIKRIDETTRQRFAEAFVAINQNFQETFNTLFGGGRAGLTLLDENDPLESGIEIVAQPPGKRLQSVQLLSGGEKALTAIALMFGLFKYKPSPFCLLDEIDAPLDDANIGRFVEMLRSMLHHTQFILITHNRKTMEIADRLYGVTMEEPGRVEAHLRPVELRPGRPRMYRRRREMQRSLRVLTAGVLTASATAFAACGPMGPYTGEAHDTWTRTYDISKTGEVSIVNMNGRVEVEGVDGSKVEVQAERIAHGATDQLARELLPQISIDDRSTPDLVHVETGRIAGILIGASFEVRYHVKTPRTTLVRVSSVNGGVEVRSLAGRASVRTTNGGVVAKDISGGLEARTVNGGVRTSLFRQSGRVTSP